MTFAHPAALLALLLLPLFAWLLRRRAGKRVLTVSSLLLWRQALVKGAPESGSRLGRWNWATVLALLFLAATILAAADPRVELQTATPAHVVIIADRSAGMATLTASGPSRWKKSVDALAELLAESSPQRVTLIGLPLSAGPAPETLSAEEALTHLRTLEPTDMPLDLPNELAAVAGFGADASAFIVLTDTPAAVPQTLNGKPVAVISFGEPSRNIAIDALEVTRTPDGKTSVFAGIANHSSAPAAVPVAIGINNDPPSFNTTLQVPPNSRKTLAQLLPVANAAQIRIDLNIADDLAADNHAVASLRPKPLRIGYAGRTNPFVLQALHQLPEVEVVDLGTGSDIGGGCDAVIFNGIAPKDLPNGDVILIDPRGEIGPIRIRDTVDSAPGLRVLAEPGLDLNWSGVLFYQAARIEMKPGAAQPLARMEENNLPLIVQWNDGRRRVIAIASDCTLAATNWPRLSAFPIFWAKLVESIAERQSTPAMGFFAAGDYIPIPGISTATPFVKGPDGFLVPLSAGAGARNFFLAQRAGLYTIEGSTPRTIAVNMIDPRESANAGEPSLDRPRLRQALSARGNRPQAELWRYLAAASLCFAFAYWGLAGRGR